MGLNLSSNSTEFVGALLKTQMFQVFTVERHENPHDPEVLFFDDSITAKMNRSKKTALTRGGKKETRFLDDTRSMASNEWIKFPFVKENCLVVLTLPSFLTDRSRKRTLRLHQATGDWRAENHTNTELSQR